MASITIKPLKAVKTLHGGIIPVLQCTEVSSACLAKQGQLVEQPISAAGGVRAFSESGHNAHCYSGRPIFGIAADATTGTSGHEIGVIPWSNQLIFEANVYHIGVDGTVTSAAATVSAGSVLAFHGTCSQSGITFVDANGVSAYANLAGRPSVQILKIINAIGDIAPRVEFIPVTNLSNMNV